MNFYKERLKKLVLFESKEKFKIQQSKALNIRNVY